MSHRQLSRSIQRPLDGNARLNCMRQGCGVGQIWRCLGRTRAVKSLIGHRRGRVLFSTSVGNSSFWELSTSATSKRQDASIRKQWQEGKEVRRRQSLVDVFLVSSVRLFAFTNFRTEKKACCSSSSMLPLDY